VAILELAMRGVEASDGDRAEIHELMSRLAANCPEVVACRLLLDVSHRRYRNGNRYKARVAVTVPGHKIVVSRRARSDPLELVYETLDAARRQVRERLGDGASTSHRPSIRGRVAAISPDEGFGTLEGPDGQHVHFEAGTVLHDAFRRLKVGTAVRFTLEMGRRDLRASEVVVDRRNRVPLSESGTLH